MHRLIAYAIFLITQCICFIICHNDPFFGDAISSTYRAANHIYENHLSTIFYPDTFDPGHPTLFPWMLALAWTIFGKSLWVAHALVMTCMLVQGIYFIRILEFTRVHHTFILFGVCCLSVFATYLSLSAMILNTAALMTLATWAVYAHLNAKNRQFIIATTLMVCIHLQATFFIVSFFAADCLCHIMSKSWSKTSTAKLVKTYSLPIILFCTWMFLHYQHTGWFLKSPHYTDTHTAKSAFTVFKSQLLIVWRILDWGMFAVHIPVVFMIFRNRCKSRLEQLYIICWLVHSSIMGFTLQHTIAHRYFFIQHVLGIVLFTHFLSYQQEYVKRLLGGFALVAILSGNFWYYPGKTIGDATLAYRSMFVLENKIEQKLIPHVPCYAYAPMGNERQSKYLENNGLNTKRIGALPLDEMPVIVYSNTTGEFPDSLYTHLATKWYGFSESEGYCYITAFINPKYTTKTSKDSIIRKMGYFEVWLRKWKQKLKTEHKF